MIGLSRKTVYLTFLLLLLLISCTKQELFFGFKSFSNTGWDKNESCDFPVQVTDTLSRYDVFVEVKNDNNYEYRNLWLFVDFKTPDGKIVKDTVNYELADIYGKWYGKGFSTYNLSLPYKKQIQFDRSGTYTFSIRQGMRTDRLKGISAIAVRIAEDSHQ